MFGGATHPKTGSFKIVERAGDIGNLGDGQVHHSASTGFIRGDRYLGSSFVGDHNASGAHDLGRTHDGTEVARICHMIEHHHECRTLPRAIDDVGNVGIRELAGFQHDTLVGTMAGNRVELGARNVVYGHLGGLESARQTTERSIITCTLRNQRALDGEPGAQCLIGSAAPLDEIANGTRGIFVQARCHLPAPPLPARGRTPRSRRPIRALGTTLTSSIFRRTALPGTALLRSIGICCHVISFIRACRSLLFIAIVARTDGFNANSASRPKRPAPSSYLCRWL